MEAFTTGSSTDSIRLQAEAAQGCHHNDFPVGGIDLIYTLGAVVMMLSSNSRSSLSWITPYGAALRSRSENQNPSGRSFIFIHQAGVIQLQFLQSVF